MKRLAGVETALANFFASGVLRLEPLRTSWPAFGRAAARGSAGARGPQLIYSWTVAQAARRRAVEPDAPARRRLSQLLALTDKEIAWR